MALMRTDFFAWDPWREFRRLQNEMNRLFREIPGAWSAPAFPPVNVWTGKEDAVVSVEIPGIDPDKLTISVDDQVLTISGTRPAEELKEGEVYHRHERPYGQFSRSIELPFRVDIDKVEAEYHNGVLSIKLPRVEEEKPRQIKVKTG